MRPEQSIAECREEMARLIDEEASVLARISNLRGEIARAEIKTKYIRQRKHEINLRIGETKQFEVAQRRQGINELIIEQLRQMISEDSFQSAVEQARRQREGMER